MNGFIKVQNSGSLTVCQALCNHLIDKITVGTDVKKVHLRKNVITETSDQETQTDDSIVVSPAWEKIEHFTEMMSLEVKFYIVFIIYSFIHIYRFHYFKLRIILSNQVWPFIIKNNICS